ncbi:hypothetical protein AB685_29115, partial [Bacillus sp. LL01]|uniref:tripartite tricarboxylate transporter substrate binding protein n=1 Tax=Bacillus sp. LL01 TaxID=1665556 RepID=UPI00064D5CF8
GKNNSNDYPSRNITNIVPFSAGGTTDANQRIIEKYWSDYFDRSMVIEYRTGAGGEVGFAELAKGEPDGYTMGTINTPHILLQPLGRPTDFDFDSFDVVARLVADPQVLAVKHDDSRFETLEEFIEVLKGNPGSLTVGTTGTLTGDHLTVLRFMQAAGVEVTIIPLAGAADQVTQLLGGHIDAIMGNVGDVTAEPDNYNILAVATEERHDWLPDTPTFKEQGIDLIAVIERGLALPKGSPREALDMLYEALEHITSLPEYQEDMRNAGLVDGFQHGDEWAVDIQRQYEEARQVLQDFDLID